MSVLAPRVAAAFSRFHAERNPRGGPIGSGHINDTYGVRADGEDFVLQRVNPTVFPRAEIQMENIRRILEHLKVKSPDPRTHLSLIETREGSAFWKDADGAVWRCYEAQPGTETVDTIDGPDRAYEVAKAFGRFQRLLADLPGPPLVETIPGFHDSRARVRALEAACAEAPDALRAQAEEAVMFARDRRDLAGAIPRSLPPRVCHYDTKVNNVLFDRVSRKAVCVVDLDTAMPGLLPIDFGDLVRSAASAAPEDCRVLARVTARPAVLEALASGFLEETGSVLTFEERVALPDAPAEIAFELGVRFLTDFLSGDAYFKTRRPAQNLDRARVQFKLAESFVRERASLARFCGV